MYNKEIKEKAKKCGVRLWKIADELGLQDCAFSRKLRKELPLEEKQRILEVIDRLAQEKQGVI